jgi:hypothetical protein
VACAADRELIRLQCYEGLDETKALYEWEYAKQLLYTQLLRDKLRDSLESASSLKEAADRIGQEEDVFFSMRFLLQRPCCEPFSARSRLSCSLMRLTARMQNLKPSYSKC